jgi:pSer/pThr/pTyr-binding forkhead associated (FHA) protein
MRSGPVPGKTFFLEEEETTLGRDLANDIAISDPEVSRRHARFFMQNDNIFVEDLGSTNGTFLNGERISSPQQLRKGDVITFGESVVMVFEKLAHELDATVARPPVEGIIEPGYPPKELEPIYPADDSRFVEEAAPYETLDADQIVYEEEPVEVSKKKPKKKAQGEGMSTWLIILIMAIVVLACVIAVILYFMPASWWCALTFDLLAGCPLP